MASGNVEVKIKLSQAQAGRLYMKAMRLEEENNELKQELGMLKIHAEHQSRLLASCEQALENRDNL